MLSTPYQHVIAPDCWFGPEGPQDYQDIYEPDWILHPVAKHESSLSNAIRSTYTVVTAYYPLEKSKHSPFKYLEWIERLSRVDIPLIVFTPASHAHLFRKGERNNRWIVEREFDELVMWSESNRRMW